MSSHASGQLRGHRLLDLIRSSSIGADIGMDGPFGPKQIVYADHTASSKPIALIEDFIRESVLPFYANTHTRSSGTGRQTTAYREEARQLVRQCVGATADHVVIFCGSGSTAAINHLISSLGLRLPRRLDGTFGLSGRIPAEERPVVFIGPYEHHSNELPWRESIADVVAVQENDAGHLCLDDLAAKLEQYKDRPQRIGSFSAASNVTGILTDVEAVTRVLHDYGALAFWDYASAGPFRAIHSGGSSGRPDDPAYRDAVFLSTHKYTGGPGTPGILIARRSLFGDVPVRPGGGTVGYVSPVDHRYVGDLEEREEGGTPDIIGSIRAGLTFELQRRVGFRIIEKGAAQTSRRMVEVLSAHPKIEVLGNTEEERLPVVSFLIKDGERYLHHNFVVGLLNDLFGIQVRGGCSCAGPYGHSLLGIDMDRSRRFEALLTEGWEGIKPGWTRVSFSYTAAADEVEYVLDAIKFVATHGWKVLPLYRFVPRTGVWTHRGWSPQTRRLVTSFFAPPPRPSGARWQENYEEAERVIDAMSADNGTVEEEPLEEEFEALRWFTLPGEAARALRGAAASTG